MIFVDEPTAVEAHFHDDGAIRVHSFTWNGQRLRVSDQGRNWTDEDGRHILVMVAGSAVFELRFDPATGAWRIIRAPDNLGVA